MTCGGDVSTSSQSTQASLEGRIQTDGSAPRSCTCLFSQYPNLDGGDRENTEVRSIDRDFWGGLGSTLWSGVLRARRAVTSARVSLADQTSRIVGRTVDVCAHVAKGVATAEIRGNLARRSRNLGSTNLLQSTLL